MHNIQSLKKMNEPLKFKDKFFTIIKDLYL